MSDTEPQSLGERFRAAREARGLSLSDVADRVRIRALYLAAIEEERWSAIGVPVYVRGFLRTYARFLGLDPEEAVADFNRTQPQSTLPRSAAGTATQPPEPAPRRTRLAIWIAAAVAVVLVAVVVYQELTFHQEQAAMAPAAPTPSASPAASEAPAAAAPSPTPGLGGSKSLALVLDAPSWLRVTVDGSVSMEGTFPAGTSKTFHGKNALLRIGNAGGVEVYVDGQDRGKLGKSGDVVEEAFTL